MNFKFDDCYVGYLNLDHRPDRLKHITSMFEKNGIKAERTRGKRPLEFNLSNPKWQVMVKRTPGALPCHYGQVEIIEKAHKSGKSAVVFEDDVFLASDWRKRMDYIEDWLNKQDDWDIFWLGSTFSVSPPYWHTGRNRDLPLRNALGRDAECTDDPRIMRTYGCFCTYAYIVNYKHIPKILSLLEDNIHLSMGIDWEMIFLQPNLKTYSFVPGMAFQIDNLSDIGAGETRFSNFLKMNGTLENSAYVYQDKLEDFNPETFNWAECKL